MEESFTKLRPSVSDRRKGTRLDETQIKEEDSEYTRLQKKYDRYISHDAMYVIGLAAQAIKDERQNEDLKSIEDVDK